ncbi:LysE family transporter [Psychromonas sp. 14N.309.X.WAT.B.A12]|uniref:LysE family translocator n=1 Tax=Psychromonas sp. 14N.309.X.WAT.B.A12 TaxID=2998322 RepID=UPI0025B055FA|nr:LysE family transporter [Psychromonas sp. 14N.309.X.WAT.B.A12]MDN2664340.1 LysE family transporter [Psychromonas sp. 14N.309.X.WAT.B.A12]
MNYLHEFLMLTLIHFLAVISPGPDFAIVLRQSISFGRKTAVITSLGIGAGIAIHVIYTLLGIGLLISQSTYLMLSAKVLGALYLTYLGINLLSSKAATNQSSLVEADNNKEDQKKAFMIGFMTNVFNPKATLFFLAIFSTIVNPHTPIAIQSIYGVWIVVTTAAWFSLVSFLFSKESVRQRFVKQGHWFERAMGGILLIFAGKLFLSLI